MALQTPNDETPFIVEFRSAEGEKGFLIATAYLLLLRRYSNHPCATIVPEYMPQLLTEEETDDLA